MSKRRKVRWIGGGVTGFLILVLLTVLLLVKNSPDERMEETLALIVEQYDFPESPYKLLIMQGFSETMDTYVAQKRSVSDVAEIIEALKAECQDCTYGLADPTKGIKDAFIFETGDSYDSIAFVHVVPHTSSSDDEGKMTVEIWVLRRPTMTLLDRIKSLWPW